MDNLDIENVVSQSVNIGGHRAVREKLTLNMRPGCHSATAHHGHTEQRQFWPLFRASVGPILLGVVFTGDSGIVGASASRLQCDILCWRTFKPFPAALGGFQRALEGRLPHVIRDAPFGIK